MTYFCVGRMFRRRNKSCIIILIHVPRIFIVLIATKKCTITITTVTLYIIYSPTCFDISMSSSGSFTFVLAKLHKFLKLKMLNHNSVKLLKCIQIIFNRCLVIH